MSLFKTHLLRAAVSVALIFLSGISGLKAEQGKFDKRALWVVRNNLANPRSIDKVVRFAKLNKINHLLVQVRGRGDAYYKTTSVSHGDYIQGNNFDPLGYIIEKAHAQGIKVHAWVNVYLVWSATNLPRDPNHILNRHPDWLDLTEAGFTDPRDLVKNIKALSEGHEGLYLSPGHPQVADELVSIFSEIVRDYEIDGLHLDYIRYQDSDFGRNPTARNIYEQNNGEDPWVLLSTASRWNGREKQYHNRLRKWSDYRRRNVTDLVKKIHYMVNETRPGCILSAAVKPNLYKARDQFYQEWDVWLAAGYLDWVFPMNYSTDLRVFASNIEIIYDNLPSKYRERIIMGLATYNQESRQVLDKLKYTRITRFSGICLFSYNTFKNDPSYIRPIYYELNK